MLQAKQQSTFLEQPRDLAEATKYCELLSKSSFVPKSYQGRVPDILVALQMGAEIGLKPLQALQNISVINGRPALWGDAMLALVKSHPDFEWISETNKDETAVCTIKRKGEPEHTITYSKQDASQADFLTSKGRGSNIQSACCSFELEVLLFEMFLLMHYAD